MAAWLPAVPALAVTVALVLAPGALLGWLLGLRGMPLAGAAPALSFTVIAGGAVAAPLLRLSWTPLTAALMLGVSAALAWFVGRLLPPARHVDRHGVRLGLSAAAAGVAGAAIPVMFAIGTPDELVDSPDAVFHLIRLQVYLDAGNGSSLLIGYPSLIHDVAMLVHQLTGTSTDVLLNLIALVSATVIWPLTMVALAHVVFRGRPAAVVGTALAVTASSVFPPILMGWGVLWPNLVGQCALPGVMALAVLAVRAVRDKPPGSAWTAWASVELVATVAALPGLALAHPNAVIALALFGLAGVVTALVRRIVLGPARARHTALLAAALASPLVAAFVLPKISPHFATTAGYTWGISSTIPEAIRTVTTSSLQWYPAWGLSVFALVGALSLLVRGPSRWLVAGFVATAALYVVAATTNGPWAALLTGFWYSDRVRLAALAVLPLSLLVGAGFDGVVGWFRRVARRSGTSVGRWASARQGIGIGVVGLIVILVTGGLTVRGRFDIVHRYYYPSEPYQTIMTSQDRADLLALVDPIPLHVVIVGDPSNGSALLYPLTGRPIVFTSIGPVADPTALLIGEHLREAATRPDVCAALAQRQVGYVVDSSRDYWGRQVKTTEGMVRLAGVEGFEPVGQQGRYTLYRVSACPGLPR